jgi:CubicO group peptidase (beta-lactamase class C family)
MTKGFCQRVLAPLFVLLCGVNATAAPPADLDVRVAQALAAFEAPGMAVAIVENGAPVLSRGYGVRRMGQGGRIDERTLFPIASNTKQFTATALALLVEEGKLNWNDKVAAHLPGFLMHDPYVTGEMTIIDLLTHRSGLGLGQGDLMIINTDFSGQEVVERLRYLKPAHGFRAAYAYDNVLYIAAGQLIEAVSGQPWEDFLRERIFAPLSMKDAEPGFAGLARKRNRIAQHGRRDGPMFGVGRIAPLDPAPPVNALANPTGGINASAADMAKWLSVQLGRGAIDGKRRLFSEAQSKALWTPHVHMPVAEPAGPLAATQPRFMSYALGFVVSDYRGHKIITHGGGWFGALSTTVLIPERKVGFAIMINSEERGALRAVELALLDHYLDQPQTDWLPLIKAERQARIDKALAAVAALQEQDSAGPPPSLPLKAYAGVYRDPWYGTMTIRHHAADNTLSIRMDRTQGMEGPLQPVRHDTFRTRWADRSLEDAYLTFMLKPDGAIDHAALRAISPLADFSFDYHDLRFTPDAGAAAAPAGKH